MEMTLGVNHQRIKTNGIWIHVAEKGTGPLVLLLHGFPEIWYAWRHQITFLANHGYHVVAPDLRGYGDSDSPLLPSSYTFFHVVGDLIGLLDHFGVQQVSLSLSPPPPRLPIGVPVFVSMFIRLWAMLCVTYRPSWWESTGEHWLLGTSAC